VLRVSGGDGFDDRFRVLFVDRLRERTAVIRGEFP
jgi:hypothetical protein